MDVHIKIVAKGFKTREPKHKGNKRLKSKLEQRYLRGRGRAPCGVNCASSQPVSRRLQLSDELEASNEMRFMRRRRRTVRMNR
ncbi:hypothetical protein CJ030_MR8G027529 [Morella rubra]|uniref:Uncharacterized protein n=1 Tax=Morella rubra TaxID=262757 RepID=A0A6A1US63_9ROSI|nr:hypothetical protein CJ030_MR8G027529 [Morella rubra]